MFTASMYKLCEPNVDLDWIILPKAIGLKNFPVLKKTYWGNELFEKTFAFVEYNFHGRWPRPPHATINLWQQDICTMLFSIDVYWMKHPSVKLTKLHVRCLNVPWKSFYVNLPLDLCLWPSESSSGVTLLLHADWMMLKNASNQGGVNSVIVAPLLTKSRPRMLVASRKLFGG